MISLHTVAEKKILRRRVGTHALRGNAAILVVASVDIFSIRVESKPVSFGAYSRSGLC